MVSSIRFAPEDKPVNPTKIKVVGVGGGGSNTVNGMISQGLNYVNFYTVNTDIQALDKSLADNVIQIGERLVGGLGVGGKPEVGKNAATEDIAKIEEIVGDCDMVFVTAGMGGGTGTGAAPVIAKSARETGALTVGVVTMPFKFEGKQRMNNALKGLEELKDNVDSLIIIPNENLRTMIGPKTSIMESFQMVNMVLFNAVSSISDIIVVPGYINVDFNDVKTVMSKRGKALMGTGEATGDDRAKKAAQSAIHSPLLDNVSINGATGILINVTGSSAMSLNEVSEAAELVQAAADPDANIIWGTVIDDNMKDRMKVTVVATGFEKQPSKKADNRAEERQIELIPVKTQSARKEERPIIVVEDDSDDIEILEIPPISMKHKGNPVRSTDKLSGDMLRDMDYDGSYAPPPPANKNIPHSASTIKSILKGSEYTADQLEIPAFERKPSYTTSKTPNNPRTTSPNLFGSPNKRNDPED